MQEVRDKKDNKETKKQDKIKQKQLKKEQKEQYAIAEQLKRQEARAIRENWFKLDNAALIYPAIRSSRWNTVFRLSVVTHQKVDAEKLQQALDETVTRYPFYNVSLCDGLFWHYFQELPNKPKIEKEVEYPCRPFVFVKNKQIFRVLYMDNKISFESFHSLTDGGGASQFFNTMLLRYFELLGAKFTDLDKYGCNVRDLPIQEETEDAFKRFYTKSKPRGRKEKVAYEVKGNYEPYSVLNTVTGVIDVASIKAIAKNYSATINELLLAVYFQVLIEEKNRGLKQKNRPIKISVPVNMRKFHKSRTMRNFSQFVNIELPLDKEKGDFNEILEVAKEQSKLINLDYLQGSINANVKSERNLFVRLLPLGVKDFMLKLIYNRVGERLFTTTLTNLGVMALPEEASNYIKHYFVVLGATKLNKINLTAVSYRNECSISFSSRLVENKIIGSFFRKLANFGLEIKLFSNLKGGRI